MTVAPRETLTRRLFAGPAIALALALFGILGFSPSAVRNHVSPWMTVGATAAGGWCTVRRWVDAVAAGKLFAQVWTGLHARWLSAPRRLSPPTLHSDRALPKYLWLHSLALRALVDGPQVERRRFCAVSSIPPKKLPLQRPISPGRVRVRLEAHSGPGRKEMQMESLTPTSHAESVAVFRHGILGALTQAEMDRGQLRTALEGLSLQRFRPPKSKTTKSFSVATLERWYYAFKRRGLLGLKPMPRRDRGRAQELSSDAKSLLLQIRREYPSASVALILRTLVADGRLQKDVVSATTVRRLFKDEGLDRIGLRDGGGAKTRLRWQAERPGALWHGDVCHGPSLTIDGKKKSLRIHALLDDASRYIVALEAHHEEREVDMLGVFVRALRRHGPPDVLYLDNGSTYRGETLATACTRIGTALLHARPYDPEARGKMERFWRTLRQGCLDFLGSLSSLHDVNVRLWAFLDAHYHAAPHAGLMGKAPAAVFQAAPPRVDDFDEAKLRNALTTKIRRRVRRDCTVKIAGKDYELDGGHLAGRLVFLCRCLVELSEPPWVEFEGRRLEVHPVDAVKNSRRRRQATKPAHDESVPLHPAFNPPQALLDKALGRKLRPGGGL